MSHVLAYADRLVEMASCRLERGQLDAACRLLERVTSFQHLRPSIAAKANYLLAHARLYQANFSQATSYAREAVSAEADNADYHFLLAQALEEKNEPEEALEHFATAARLEPSDARKVSRYARSLARQKCRERGVRLLGVAYAAKANDPAVVADVVDGLVENEQFEEAELVVTHAVFRNKGNAQFRMIHQRWRAQAISRRLAMPAHGSDGEATVPFRTPAKSLWGKPGGSKRPRVESSSEPRPGEQEEAVGFTPPSILMDENMSMLEILRRGGKSYVHGLSQNLGLLIKDDAAAQAEHVVGFLSDLNSMRALVRSLPTESRRLLRTLVIAGGWAPANAIFQTAGPKAPPANFVQPLLEKGLVVFGHTTRNRESLMAAIPVDLLGRLTRVLRIKTEE